LGSPIEMAGHLYRAACDAKTANAHVPFSATIGPRARHPERQFNAGDYMSQ